MPDFIALTCPSCGAKLQLLRDIDQFACSHCGTEYLVNRGGGIVSLAPVVHELKQVKQGVDKTASELAIKRIEEEISELWRKITVLKEELKKKISDLQFASFLPITPYRTLLTYYFDDAYPKTTIIQKLSSTPLYGSIEEAIDRLTERELKDMIGYFSQDLSRLFTKPLGIKTYSPAYSDILNRLRGMQRVYDEIAKKKEELQRHKNIVSS